MILSCLATIVINLSNTSWNQYDTVALNRATEYCKSQDDTPCLKKFIKKEDSLYNAICGVGK